MIVDYLIVGSGLTGAVIARTLADAGRSVLVVDRRSHMGGNVHDHTHKSGIKVHTYGPHYFRTSSNKIWDFANRFGTFYQYEAALLSLVEGELVQWPIAESYIRDRVGLNWKPEFVGKPTNFEEAALGLMPRKIYELFIKEYNEKQWGVAAETLSPELCRRFDVRPDDEPRLKPNAIYQGLPVDGYAEWMKNLLKGIPTVLNFDFLQRRNDFSAKKWLVFTGPIDEFFDFDEGRLDYRGQHRRHTYLKDIEGFAQKTGQVNVPTHSGGKHIRTLEWKHMLQPEQAQRIKGTLLTTETPFTPTSPSEYEYPFPDTRNSVLYKKYRRRAHALENTLICGRLGEYRYYDMDQAIARAMFLADRLLSNSGIDKSASEFSEV